ncbi:MAG TPA: DUF2231 domain-containing protein [Acidimicrobiia bacterium]|nr:DUF2231 domain-containing protein [Acidimicrobiia bacterium]
MAIETERRVDDDTQRLADAAKEPKSKAAGPYGHPFHPMLVTIPIGAWVASLVFDVASRLSADGSPALVEGSYWLIAIGVVGGLLAGIFGLMDMLTIPRQTRAFGVALTHMGLNLLVIGLYVGNFFWRNSDYQDVSEVGLGQIALSGLALLLLAVSGWLGGHLTYRYGVRVAREPDQADGFRVH